MNAETFHQRCKQAGFTSSIALEPSKMQRMGGSDRPWAAPTQYDVSVTLKRNDEHGDIIHSWAGGVLAKDIPAALDDLWLTALVSFQLTDDSLGYRNGVKVE